MDGTTYALSAKAGWDTFGATAQSLGAGAVTAAGVYQQVQAGVFDGSAANVGELNALITAADNATSGSFEIDVKQNDLGLQCA